MAKNSNFMSFMVKFSAAKQISLIFPAAKSDFSFCLAKIAEKTFFRVRKADFRGSKKQILGLQIAKDKLYLYWN